MLLQPLLTSICDPSTWSCCGDWNPRGFSATHPVHGSMYDIWHQHFQLKAAAWCLQHCLSWPSPATVVRLKVRLLPRWQLRWTLFRLQKTQNVCQKLQETMPVSQCVVINVNMARPMPEPKRREKFIKLVRLVKSKTKIPNKSTLNSQDQTRTKSWHKEHTHAHTHTEEIKESGTDGREETVDIHQEGGGAYRSGKVETIGNKYMREDEHITKDRLTHKTTPKLNLCCSYSFICLNSSSASAHSDLFPWILVWRSGRCVLEQRGPTWRSDPR